MLKISHEDQRAVVQVPEGKLLVVKPGDTLPGWGKITEIAPGRIVCTATGERGPETVIIRTDGKKQSVSRVAGIPEKRPPLVAPVVSKSPSIKKISNK